MTNPLAEALDRTLLLMRDCLTPSATDAQMITALTGTTVALVGTERNLATHSAQCAYVTAALLMARSGHRIFLVAPDVTLAGAQPPLTGTNLVSALVEVGRDLLPGIEFSVGLPAEPQHAAVFFGDSDVHIVAGRSIYVNATDWSAQLSGREQARPWHADTWPCGGLAAGVLAATEVFKTAMQLLRALRSDELLFDDLFAPANDLSFAVAPASAPKGLTLGEFDLISGGAITQAALFALTRVPGIAGRGRVMDAERTDLSNLNRYALLRRSSVEQQKAGLLSHLGMPRLDLQPIAAHYEGGEILGVRLRPRVLVGVDDIRVRWRVQEAGPQWLGIGATTHWCAMASFHRHGLGCARCLHPRDDEDRSRIPTAPFVSFLAGLQLASYFLRTSAGEAIPSSEQYTYCSPLRLERVWRSAVSPRPRCPTCGRGTNAAA
jgi:hypothetical protein